MAVKCEKHSKKLIEKLFKTTNDSPVATTSNKEAPKKSKKKTPAKANSIKKTVNSDLDMDVEEYVPATINKVIEEKQKSEKTNSSNNITPTNINLNHISVQNQNEETEKKIASSKINSHSPDVEMSAAEEDDDPNDSLHISTKERERLAERIKCLANDGLASVVRLVQKECPSCIEDLNEDKLMIRITGIDRKTYEQINQ